MLLAHSQLLALHLVHHVRLLDARLVPLVFVGGASVWVLLEPSQVIPELLARATESGTVVDVDWINTGLATQVATLLDRARHLLR